VGVLISKLQKIIRDNYKPQYKMKTLKNISIIISILGISILIILSLTQQPQTITANQIENLKENTYIKISGTLKSSKIYNNNFQILELTNNNTQFTTILFNNQNFQKNSNLTIIGIISIYQNNKQIQAEKIYL